ncbi:MAG TPA: response regulator transcription factor [Vicinamibacterales bacterium]|nr:response regulator transcription factor [Vicinamibacterales bacterium]
MQVLIADDDAVLRHALKVQLERWSYQVIECADGAQAWAAMVRDSPPLAIVDWNMPGADGPTLCAELRRTPALSAMYVILLTGNTDRKDVIAGLESSADDYIVKPFDWDELRARLRIGTRIVGLQQALNARVAELQAALANVRKLSGLLPICAYCKRVRDDRDYWQRIEEYLSERSEAQFSHGICPECLRQQLAGEQ